MSIPIELTPEYQEEVERWRRTWGYEPKRDDILKILAKREFKEALQRLFDEFKAAYNISAEESSREPALVFQHLTREILNEEYHRGQD
jgi:hypothetical protein